jgi:SAM-dependent methyltransferase
MTLDSQQASYPTNDETIKIVTEGRLTKLPHVVKIRFVFLDGSFYALSGEFRSDWVLNALKTGRARVRTRELVLNALANLANATEKAAVLKAFALKYGSRVMRDWYASSADCLRLTPVGAATQRGAVKGEGETTTTYLDWLSHNRDYYGGIADAFDSASEEYDFTINNNYINTWIRKRSIRELLRFAKPEDTLLEVGCGTGAEALEISRHVSKIIATDISESMIQLVTKKVEAKHLANRIFPLRVRASEISKVSELLNGERVGAAYSFNGALNCEPDMEKFVLGLSSVLAHGGYFICSVRNPLCLGEAISHAAVLQFDKMAPRKKQPVMVSVGGMDIPAFYYTPSTFVKFFSSKFKLKRLIGLPVVLPPAYLSDYIVKFKSVVSILERMEMVLGSHTPFNRFGDQTLFVFQNE